MTTTRPTHDRELLGRLDLFRNVDLDHVMPLVERCEVREMAEGFAAAQNDPDSLFDSKRLHWRNDRIECALRVGLGPWLVEELAADRAFLSPIPE